MPIALYHTGTRKRNYHVPGGPLSGGWIKKQEKSSQLMEETGEIVPTDGRNRQKQEGTAPVKRGSKAAEREKRSFC